MRSTHAKGSAHAQLFVSYSRSDQAEASKLIKRLRTLGWTVTWDQDFQTGVNSWLEIRACITDAQKVLVLWSKNTKGVSAWVCAEAAWGTEKLFPIRLDKKACPPGPFLDRHYIDLFSIRMDRFDPSELKKLVDRLPEPENKQTYGARNMPMPPDPCVGREDDIERAVQALSSDKPGSVVVTGGIFVGKTGLCTTVFEDDRLVEKYDMERYYVDLKSARSAEDVFRSIADTLMLPAETFNKLNRISVESNQKLGSDAAAIINYLHEQPTLLFLENFEIPFRADKAKITMFLGYINRISISTWIIAVRGPDVPQIAATMIRLRPLDETSVRKLFLALAGFSERQFEGELDLLNGILKRFTGGLPFRVRLCANAAGLAHIAINEKQDRGKKCEVLRRRFAALGRQDEEIIANAINTPVLEQHSKRLLSLLGCVPDGLARQDVLAMGRLLHDFDGEVALEQLTKSGLAEWSASDDRILISFPVWEVVRKRSPSPADQATLWGYFLALACFGNGIDFGSLEDLQDKLRTEFDNIGEVLLAIFKSSVSSDGLLVAFSQAQNLIRPGARSVNLQVADEIAIFAAVALARFQQFTGYAGSFLRNTEPLAAALQRAEDLKMPLRVAECHRLFGVLRSSEGEFDEALLRYGQARDVYEMLSGYEKKVGIAHCIRNMASTEMKRNEYELARDGLEDAVALYHELEQMRYDGNLPSVGYGGTIYRKEELVKGMAVCQERLAHLDKAEQKLESAGQKYNVALKNFEKIGDFLGQATCYKGFADLDSDIRVGKLQMAHERYQKAIKYFHKVGYMLGEADCLYSLGDLALKMAIKAVDEGHVSDALNRFEESQRFYQQAQHEYEDLKDKHGIGICVSSIVDVKLASGSFDRVDLDELLEGIRKSLWCFDQTKANDDVSYANCYECLADIFKQIGDDDNVKRNKGLAAEHWREAFRPTPTNDMYMRPSFPPIGAMGHRWRK